MNQKKTIVQKPPVWFSSGMERGSIPKKRFLFHVKHSFFNFLIAGMADVIYILQKVAGTQP